MTTEKLDSELGELVRAYRLASGLSQVELGDAAGISYQQIQKYESGANKISVTRLFAVASALRMSPSEILSELERRLVGRKGAIIDDSVECLDFMASRRGQQAIRALASCDDPKLIDAFVDLLLAATASRRRMNGSDDRQSVSR